MGKIDSRSSKNQKNYLINGAFDFWQRGTSATSGAIVYSTADRWWHYGDYTSWSLAQVSDTSNGSKYAMRMTVTTLGGGTELSISQPLETATVLGLQGKTVTLSCLLKPNVSFTGYCTLFIKWGTGTDERNPTGGAAFSKIIAMNTLSTSQYTKVFLTATIPSNATSLSTAIGMLSAGVQAGSTLDVKNVMLNEGSAAASFQTFSSGSISDELAACQRYYETGRYTWCGYAGTSAQDYGSTVYFKTTKRNNSYVTGGVSSLNSNFSASLLFADKAIDSMTVKRASSGVGYGIHITDWTVDAEL